MPVRVQLSPSSALIMTPWPIVPTRMVPGFAMLHLLGVRTVPLFLRRDYTPIGEGPRGFERTGGCSRQLFAVLGDRSVRPPNVAISQRGQRPTAAGRDRRRR